MEQDRNKIHALCESYFLESHQEHEFLLFQNAKEVLDYSSNYENPIIDLLFLDIEMDDINGIALMNLLPKNKKIWKIVFVSSHTEAVFQAFSNKTIGFIEKPIEQGQMAKYLDFILQELQENVCLSFKDSSGVSFNVKIDDILYIEAAGSYSKIYHTVDF